MPNIPSGNFVNSTGEYEELRDAAEMLECAYSANEMVRQRLGGADAKRIEKLKDDSAPK
jgi:hypothetical protein